MTIHLFVRGDGFTKDIYENARKEVNWEGNPPPGMVLHAASFDTLATFVLPTFGNQRINGTTF